MSFTWIKGSTSSPVVTVYDNNITLNNAAANYFADAKYAMLGIDYENLTIAIKPIKKRELDLKLYEHMNLNRVSFGRGYARISNKTFIEEIKQHVDHSVAGLKFQAVFKESDDMLVVNLKKGEVSV